MSYFFHAFLFSKEPPPAAEAREYLLEGVLFDDDPEILILQAPDGQFEEMRLNYAPGRQPIILRRLSGDDAEANRAEAMEAAALAGNQAIENAIQSAPLVMEFEVERAELDDDAWFALRLWMAWILGPSKGWLYESGNGIFDFQLQRKISLRD